MSIPTPIRFLILDAAAAGLKFSVNGDELIMRGPRAAAALAEALRAYEREVIDELRQCCRQCYTPLYRPESKALGICSRCMTDDQWQASLVTAKRNVHVSADTPCLVGDVR